MSTPNATNAERLQRAAQATLDEIKVEGLTGNAREHRAALKLFELISHARFLDEQLPGITIKRPGDIVYAGTSYTALQRIAKGK